MADMQFIKCRDPRIDLESNFKKTYAIVQPATEVTYREFPSQSPTTTTQQTIVATPPGMGTCVSRQVLVKAGVTFTWPAGTTLTQSHDGPRAFPIQSCITSAQVTFNTTQVTTDSSDIIHAMSRFYTLGAPKVKGYSIAPTMPDQFATYAMGGETNSNPLGSRLDQATDSPPSRNAFPMTYYKDPANVNPTTVTAEFCEPLFLSPFSWADDDGLGLYGIQNLTFQFNFGPLARMWSHDAGAGALVDPVVSFTSFSLLFTYLTPPVQSVPKVLTYPYYQIQKYTVDDTTARAADADFVSTPSPVIQMNGMPNAIYIFAQKQKSTLTKEDSDCYLGINSVQQMTLMNETGKLAGATSQQLYKISARNGYSVSYPDWTAKGQPIYDLTAPILYIKGCGSVLKLEPIDLGLPNLKAAGSRGLVQMQFTLNLHAPVALASGYTLYCLIVYEGKFDITSTGSTLPDVSLLTEKDILDAPMVDSAMAARNARTLGSGHLGGFGIGDFFNGFKNVLGEVLPIAKDVLGVLNDGKKLIGRGSVGGKKGRGAGIVGAGVIGAGDSYGDGDGAGRLGGQRMMSRHELAERL